MPESISVAHPLQKKESHQSVKRLLVILIGAVFFIEVIVLDVVLSFTRLTKTQDAFLNATLLSLLLFPVFYYLIFRPLVRNIDERKRIEADLRIAAVAFEIKDLALITDANANIIRANQKFLDKLGYDMQEIAGKKPSLFQSGMHDQKYYTQLWKQLLNEGSWSGEIRIKNKEGRILHPLWLTITAVKNELQETTHYIGIYNF